MIQIRNEQMQVFEQAALKKFEDEMVAHGREFSPLLGEALGEEQLRVAIRQAMKRADGYGFTLRGPLRTFIEMIFLFGSDFDTDPQYPWAAKILRSSDEQMKRAEQLYDNMVDYQEKVSGPDDANTRRSLGKLKALIQKPAPFPPGAFVAGMSDELTRAFPEKAARIGTGALTGLINESGAGARKYRFLSDRGEALVVVLMFAFGHGCAMDPLYPWIGGTLNDQRISDAAARADQLETRAVAWLERVLAPSRKGAEL